MPATYKNLVIGTSLGESSDDVVRTGVLIAKATGASPWLVHAYVPTVFTPELTDPSLLELQEEGVRVRLEEQASRTGLADVASFKPGQVLPAIGSSSEQLVEIARQVGADLLVVGASEGGAARRLLLGSTAAGVIRKAPCPVLVLRSAASFPPLRVEMPVDLSPVSASAFRQGLEFLRQIGVPFTETEVFFVLGPVETPPHFSREQLEGFAHDELCRFIGSNRRGPCPQHVSIRSGSPREEILAALAERQADLAILGTHGRTGFERLTLGSVTADVMHRCRCNLLVVPPDVRLRGEAAVTDGEVERRGPDWDFISDEMPAVVASAPAAAVCSPAG